MVCCILTQFSCAGAPGRNKAIGGAFLYDLSTQVNEPEEMMDISVEQDQGDYTQVQLILVFAVF